MHIKFRIIIVLLCFVTKVDAQKNKSDFSKIIFEKKLKGEKLIGTDYIDFNVKINDTISINNQNLKGKITFINFWFESCHPCIAEMNGLDSLYDTFKDNPSFQFLSFTYDNQEQINANIDKFHILYKVYHLNDNVIRKMNYHNGFPVSLIIDKKGKIALFSAGGYPEINKATQHVMNEYIPKIKSLLIKQE